MSVARVRALTPEISNAEALRDISRNECCPCEGIDTAFFQLVRVITVRRNECCPCEGIDTISIGIVVIVHDKVEMSVARVRALTPADELTKLLGQARRNECCPCEGIGTL